MFTRVTILVAVVLLGMSSAFAAEPFPTKSTGLSQAEKALQKTARYVLGLRQDEVQVCKGKTEVRCHDTFNHVVSATFHTLSASSDCRADAWELPKGCSDSQAAKWNSRRETLRKWENELKKFYPKESHLQRKRVETVGFK